MNVRVFDILFGLAAGTMIGAALAYFIGTPLTIVVGIVAYFVLEFAEYRWLRRRGKP